MYIHIWQDYIIHSWIVLELKLFILKGYTQTKNDSVIDLDEKFAWTIAKINDKWISLNSI